MVLTAAMTPSMTCPRARPRVLRLFVTVPGILGATLTHRSGSLPRSQERLGGGRLGRMKLELLPKIFPRLKRFRNPWICPLNSSRPTNQNRPEKGGHGLEKLGPACTIGAS